MGDLFKNEIMRKTVLKDFYLKADIHIHIIDEDIPTELQSSVISLYILLLGYLIQLKGSIF